jgi:hypothetical protein
VFFVTLVPRFPTLIVFAVLLKSNPHVEAERIGHTGSYQFVLTPSQVKFALARELLDKNNPHTIPPYRLDVLIRTRINHLGIVLVSIESETQLSRSASDVEVTIVTLEFVDFRLGVVRHDDMCLFVPKCVPVRFHSTILYFS